MSDLRLVNIAKKYPNGYRAISNLSLEIAQNEFISIVGPSGSGKTTLLNMISGIENISGGELYIGDVLMNKVAAKQRDVALVMQNNALFPYMSVYENIAYGLKSFKLHRTEVDKRVIETAENLGIKEYLQYKPKMLSAGQSQRVTIARAIVRKPKIFLMDEPLSNLDLPLKIQLRSVIHDLYEKLGLTFLYVTHDQLEAMSLATKLLVIKNGEIQQFDTPQNVYEYPNNLFVASFIGMPQINLFETILMKKQEKIFLKIGNYELLLPDDKAKIVEEGGYIDKEVISGLRPHYFFLSRPNNTQKSNLFKGKVFAKEMIGADSNIYIKALGQDLCITIKSDETINNNDVIKFSMNTSKFLLFDKVTGLTIVH